MQSVGGPNKLLADLGSMGKGLEALAEVQYYQFMHKQRTAPWWVVISNLKLNLGMKREHVEGEFYECLMPTYVP